MGQDKASKRAPAGPPRGRRDDLGRAVLFMIIAAVLLPTLNAGAKYLSARYPIVEITFFRYAGHFLYMLIAFAPVHGRRLLVSSRPLVQMARSTLLCASTLFFLSGLSVVSLPTAAAISFTGPLIVTALSPFLLGERVGAWRWGAVVAGFMGALVIVRPGAAPDSLAGGLVLVGAACGALYQIFSRRFAGYDPTGTSITYMALVGMVMTALPLPLVWKTPETLLDLLVFASLGFFGGVGHYFMMRGFELAPAPFISPFNYLQLITATGLSFALFSQLPDTLTWIGAAVIVSSGIVILYRERLQSSKSRA